MGDNILNGGMFFSRILKEFAGFLQNTPPGQVLNALDPSPLEGRPL